MCRYNIEIKAKTATTTPNSDNVAHKNTYQARSPSVLSCLCQVWCRNWPTEAVTHAAFSGYVIILCHYYRGLSACTQVLHSEVTLWLTGAIHKRKWSWTIFRLSVGETKNHNETFVCDLWGSRHDSRVTDEVAPKPVIKAARWEAAIFAYFRLSIRYSGSK